MRLFTPKLLKSKLPTMVQKIFARASNLLHNMCDQAEVVFNQEVSRLNVPVGGLLQVLTLLLGSKGFGKAAGLQLQGIEHTADDEPDRWKHSFHLDQLYSSQPVPIRVDSGLVCTGAL